MGNKSSLSKPSASFARTAKAATLRLLTLPLAVALCFPAPTLAQSVNPQALLGSVSVVQSGNRTMITTQNGAAGSHSVINWQSFGVPAGASTWFTQPGALSTSINRVTGNDPSLILGRLGSNGRLVLVNPAGITVGAGAAVDTAGFTASTLSMAGADATAGRLRFGADGGTVAGMLSVQGRVLARHGDVVLIGQQVETGRGAVIESIGGDTILAAGQQVELTGRGLEGIHLQLQAPTDSAVNLGRLLGDSVGIFARQLQHSGSIHASSASVHGGRVLLTSAASAVSGGAVSARAGDVGGSVYSIGDRLLLKAASSIDVSGLRGGAAVRIVGGRHGTDAIATAQTLDAETGVQLRADAQLSAFTVFAPVPGAKPMAFAAAGDRPFTNGTDQAVAMAAAVQEQTSLLNAFIARPPLPATAAQSPRKRNRDDEQQQANMQCVFAPGDVPWVSVPSALWGIPVAFDRCSR